MGKRYGSTLCRQSEQGVPNGGELFGGGDIDLAIGGQSQVGNAHALGAAAANQQDGGMIRIGRIRGIDRPALAPVIPGKNKPFLLIDSGASKLQFTVKTEM